MLMCQWAADFLKLVVTSTQQLRLSNMCGRRFSVSLDEKKREKIPNKITTRMYVAGEHEWLWQHQNRLHVVLTRCTTQLLTYLAWLTMKSELRGHVTEIPGNPFSKEFQKLWMHLLNRLSNLFSPGAAFCCSCFL